MIGINVAGVFGFQTTGRVINASGESIGNEGVFTNLILNGGYSRMRNTSLLNLVTALRLGSGNTAPTVADSTLAVDSGKAIPRNAVGTCAIDGGDPNTLVYTTQFVYMHDDLTSMNVREFGIAATDTGLICRSLVKDVSNTPITILLTRGDKLTVTYSLRITMAPIDTQYTHTVDYASTGITPFASVIRLSTKPWQAYAPEMVLMPSLAGVTDAMARATTGTSGPERATLAMIPYNIQKGTFTTSGSYSYMGMNFHGSMINAADDNTYTVATDVYTNLTPGGPNGSFRDTMISFNLDYQVDNVEQISTFILGFPRGFERLFYPLGVITFSVPYPKEAGRQKIINNILRMTFT